MVGQIIVPGTVVADLRGVEALMLTQFFIFLIIALWSMYSHEETQLCASGLFRKNSPSKFFLYLNHDKLNIFETKEETFFGLYQDA